MNRVLHERVSLDFGNLERDKVHCLLVVGEQSKGDDRKDNSKILECPGLQHGANVLARGILHDSRRDARHRHCQSHVKEEAGCREEKNTFRYTTVHGRM